MSKSISTTCPRIIKTDGRFKNGGGRHEAVETEALSQMLIVDIVRDWLDARLPQALDRVAARPPAPSHRSAPMSDRRHKSAPRSGWVNYDTTMARAFLDALLAWAADAWPRSIERIRNAARHEQTTIRNCSLRRSAQEQEGACRAIVTKKTPAQRFATGNGGHKSQQRVITMKKTIDKLLSTAGAGGSGATSSIPDASDIETLWLNPALGDGIVDVHFHSVPVGKPRDFFRTVIDPAYRRRTEIYTHKPEGAIDEVNYIIAPAMHGQIPEARPCTLVTVVHRDGSPRLWPIKFPRDGERDNEAWASARAAAKIGMERWVKLVWVRRAYQTRDALPGYAPDPDLSKLPPYNELVRLGFGDHGIIRGKTHPIYRELFGMPNAAAGDTGDRGDF